jgi:hypothetical protein
VRRGRAYTTRLKPLAYAVLAGVCLIGTFSSCASSANPQQPPGQTITINPVEEYAKEIGLSDEYVAILKPLGDDKKLDDSDKAAVNDAKNILSMSSSENAKRITIGYLASGRDREYESAYSLLESTSNLSVKRMHELGIDENVVNYISFVSSLPDKAFAKYALENALCIEDRQLTELEKSFLQSPDANSQQLFDQYFSDIDRINPELVTELKKIPDLENLQIDSIRKLEGLEDILVLASDSDYKATFYSMLNEGIKGNRSVCTPLEAAFIIACKKEFSIGTLDAQATLKIIAEGGNINDYYNPLKGYSIKVLMNEVWTKGLDTYRSDIWEDYNKATERLNSPELLAEYLKGHSKIFFTNSLRKPYQTFKEGGSCKDYTYLGGYCLDKAGYKVYLITALSKANEIHCILAYEDHGLFYITANTSSPGYIGGPYKTIDEAALKGVFYNQESIQYNISTLESFDGRL